MVCKRRTLRIVHVVDTGQGPHMVSQTTLNDPKPEVPPVPVDGLEEPAVLEGSELLPQADDGSIIDVLVAYTPASRSRYGQPGIEALIDLSVAEANQAYVNSQINTQLRLVHKVEVTYTEVDGFSLQPDGSLLLSFDASFTLSPLGSVDDSDIIRFVPTSLGATTAGQAEWYFDASDVGLDTNDEDIDAIGFAPDGRLLVSTVGRFSVPGVSGDDVDLIAFTPASLGANTSGTWSLYFDGSDVGLSPGGSEDVYGVWVDPANGQIYLTTLGSFSVTGVSGGGDDIFVCTPGTLGATTTCTFGPGLFWDGAAHGFNYVVDGFEIKRP